MISNLRRSRLIAGDVTAAIPRTFRADLVTTQQATRQEQERASQQAEALAEQQASAATAFRHSIDPTRAYAAEVKRLTDFYPEFVQQLGSAEEAQRVLDQTLSDAPPRIKALETANSLSRSAERFGLVFTSAFEDAIVEGRGLGEAFQGLEQDVIRLITRMLILEPLMEGIRGGFEGAGLGDGGDGGGISDLVSGGIKGALGLFGFNAATAHAGGVVGHLGAPSRFVSFADVVRAERFHDGGIVGPLPKLPGERVILARDGETIRTPEQERAMQPRLGGRAAAPRHSRPCQRRPGRPQDARPDRPRRRARDPQSAWPDRAVSDVKQAAFPPLGYEAFKDAPTGRMIRMDFLPA